MYLSRACSRGWLALASLLFALGACAAPQGPSDPPKNILAYGEPPAAPKKAPTDAPAPANLDGASTKTDENITSEPDQPHLTSLTYFGRPEGFLANQAHLLGGGAHLFQDIRIENPTKQKVHLEVRGALQGFTIGEAVGTADVGPGETLSSFFDATMDFKALDALASSVNANLVLQVSMNGKLVSAFQQSLRILPKNAVFFTSPGTSTLDPLQIGLTVGTLTTPHDGWKEVDKLLQSAAPLTPRGAFVGYQYQTPTSTLDADAAAARDQLSAIYEQLATSGMAPTSVDAAFFTGAPTLRFPAEALRGKSANCVEASLVFASALEAIGMAPFLVLVPGHALVGVHLGKKGTTSWSSAYFVETTVLAAQPFQSAIQLGLSRWNTTATTGRIVVELADLRATGILPSPLPM